MIVDYGSRAYDKAAIKCNGREAVTNFELSSYGGEITSPANNEGYSLWDSLFCFSMLHCMLFDEKNISLKFILH